MVRQEEKMITISVRNLVEFVLRSGDLDNRRDVPGGTGTPCRREAASTGRSRSRWSSAGRIPGGGKALLPDRGGGVHLPGGGACGWDPHGAVGGDHRRDQGGVPKPGPHGGAGSGAFGPGHVLRLFLQPGPGALLHRRPGDLLQYGDGGDPAVSGGEDL